MISYGLHLLSYDGPWEGPKHVAPLITQERISYTSCCTYVMFTDSNSIMGCSSPRRPRTNVLSILVLQFGVQEYEDQDMWSYNFACCFVCIRNLVFHIEGGIQAEGVRG